MFVLPISIIYIISKLRFRDIAAEYCDVAVVKINYKNIKTSIMMSINKKVFNMIINVPKCLGYSFYRKILKTLINNEDNMI